MEFLVILLLALLNGVFAMSEMALVSARKVRLTNLAEQGNKAARAALNLASAPDRFLATVQIGITVIGTVSAVFGGSTLAEPLALFLAESPWLAPYAHPLAFGLVVATISYLTLVLGELVPKRLALHYPERMAMLVALPLSALSKLSRPLVWVLSKSSGLVLGVFGVRNIQSTSLTEEEIRLVLAEGALSGALEKSEHNLMHRALELADRPVTSLMRPRSEIRWLDLEASPEENLTRIRGGSHSRYPVCRNGLDNLVGFVRTQELLESISGLADALRGPLLIPEHFSAMQLLEKFKSSGVHMGLVVDEYGSIVGVVTVNDVMEAIVGDIADEGSSEPLAIRRDDGSWLFDGTLEMSEMFAHLDLEPPEKVPYHTVAGFTILHVGRIPREGDHFVYQDWKLEVMDMDQHRVDKILATRMTA